VSQCKLCINFQRFSAKGAENFRDKEDNLFPLACMLLLAFCNEKCSSGLKLRIRKQHLPLFSTSFDVFNLFEGMELKSL